MIRIAIVEDSPEDSARIEECLAYVREKDQLDMSVKRFADADHFFFDTAPDYDLILLDILMPGMNGMDAAKRIRVYNRMVGIVFVTTMSQLAIKGYEVDALDFIVKPVNVNDFYLKMHHILARLHFFEKDQVILKNGEKVVSIAVNSILYIDVSGHYVTYHTSSESFEQYTTLKETEKMMEPYTYIVRASRYYLVNLNHVDEIRGDEVIVGGFHVPVSRAEKPRLKSLLASHFINGI
ncbi:MAG: LytTR family DNA-binding domain-containing protein [Clostridia bacterium]|nr:LytTR family DNA-binding domain-containing protein [Clostridia bacterium]